MTDKIINNIFMYKAVHNTVRDYIIRVHYKYNNGRLSKCVQSCNI